jgi:hypothetical protein
MIAIVGLQIIYTNTKRDCRGQIEKKLILQYINFENEITF